MPLYPRWSTKPPAGTPIDSSHPLARGFVVAYAFNEATGPALANAANAGANNAALQNAPAWVSGQYGPAIVTAAARSQYASAGIVAGLGGPNLFSLMAWGNRAGGTNWSIGRSSAAGGNKTAFQVLLDTTNTFYFQTGDGTTDSSCHCAAPAGDFSIAVTLNAAIASTAALAQYVNGQSQPITLDGGTPTGNGLANEATPFMLGNDQADALYTDGRFDVVYLWIGHLLTPAEVLWLHADPFSMFAVPPVYWLMSAPDAAPAIVGTPRGTCVPYFEFFSPHYED